MKYTTILLALFLSVTLTLTACSNYTPPEPTAKQAQSQKALAAAESITYTENAEIENIKARLQLTANPGLLGYVVLLNEMGQPVFYTGVKGKITSGSKRLTRADEIVCEYQSCNIRAAASDEGTFGSSSEYHYFWTTSGQYMQWNGKYLYSDKPLRLTQEPLVVSTVSAK